MAGNTVEVAGTLGAKEMYWLTKVEHHWEPSGYANSFAATPWKNYRNPRQPALRGVVWGGAGAGSGA